MIGQHLSDLSCFLQRQTKAAAFALPGRSSGVTSHQHPVDETSAPATPYHLDMPLSFVSRRPCIWNAGHGRSEAKQAITDTSAERQVTIIQLTIDLLSRAVTNLDSRKSRNSFPGIEKKDRDSSLVNIANDHTIKKSRP